MTITVSDSTRTELTVPFGKLRPSPRNVRKTERANAPMSIEALAMSIEAVGVVQNLIVTAGKRGTYEVEGGGRRLRALELLHQRKKITDDYPVRCLLVPADEAATLSLTENTQREAMHPADEFVAFKQLVDAGKRIEDVAAAFGVTPVVVQRRLKLACLSPKLLAEYRADRIDLAQLMALTLTEDHALQESVWFEAQHYQRQPHQLRERLTEREVPLARDGVARFVGLDAYRAAGGVVRTDLFADDDQGVYLSDRELLDKLAQDKLAALVEPVQAEGWLWVETQLRVDTNELYRWQRVHPSRRKPEPAEAKKIAALEKKRAKLSEQMEAAEVEDGDGEAFERLEAQYAEVEADIEALQASLRTFAKKDQKVSGVIIYVNRSGKVVYERGLVREEEAKALRAAAKAKEKAKAQAQAEAMGAPVGPALSEALMQRLTAHRTMAVQLELVRQPGVALALLAQTMVLKVLRGGYHDVPVKIDCRSKEASTLAEHAPELPGMPAAQAFNALREQLTALLPCDAGEDEPDADALLRHLCGLPAEDVQRLLALCVALCVDTVTRRPVFERSAGLAQALQLDMTQTWTATADEYFNHVSKAHSLEVVAELDAEKAKTLTGAKKAELAAAAAVLASAARWLPAPLRRGE